MFGWKENERGNNGRKISLETVHRGKWKEKKINERQKEPKSLPLSTKSRGFREK